MPVRCAVGPLVWDGAEAHASFVEARALLEEEVDYPGVLVETLARWLDSGCHATATAARLHIERQTPHKRLAKAFELLEEDPREHGDVFPLHVAVRVAMLRTDS